MRMLHRFAIFFLLIAQCKYARGDTESQTAMIDLMNHLSTQCNNLALHVSGCVHGPQADCSNHDFLVPLADSLKVLIDENLSCQEVVNELCQHMTTGCCDAAIKDLVYCIFPGCFMNCETPNTNNYMSVSAATTQTTAASLPDAKQMYLVNQPEFCISYTDEIFEPSLVLHYCDNADIHQLFVTTEDGHIYSAEFQDQNKAIGRQSATGLQLKLTRCSSGEQQTHLWTHEASDAATYPLAITAWNDPVICISHNGEEMNPKVGDEIVTNYCSALSAENRQWSFRSLTDDTSTVTSTTTSNPATSTATTAASTSTSLNTSPTNPATASSSTTTATPTSFEATGDQITELSIDHAAGEITIKFSNQPTTITYKKFVASGIGSDLFNDLQRCRKVKVEATSAGTYYDIGRFEVFA